MLHKDIKENKEKNNARPAPKQLIVEAKLQIKIKKQWNESDFTILANLNAGKFGIVKKALHKQTGTIVAFKYISKGNLRQFNCLEQIKTEIEIHSRLSHSYIIEC